MTITIYVNLKSSSPGGITQLIHRLVSRKSENHSTSSLYFYYSCSNRLSSILMKNPHLYSFEILFFFFEITCYK